MIPQPIDSSMGIRNTMYDISSPQFIGGIFGGGYSGDIRWGFGGSMGIRSKFVTRCMISYPPNSLGGFGAFDGYSFEIRNVMGIRNPPFKWGVPVQRGRDSNPRYGFPYTHFPGVLLQPLGHLSVCCDLFRSGVQIYAIPPYFPNISSARWEVRSITSVNSNPFTSARRCATNGKNAGSFFLPRWGTGDK